MGDGKEMHQVMDQIANNYATVESCSFLTHLQKEAVPFPAYEKCA